jgi:hypothetical protein
LKNSINVFFEESFTKIFQGNLTLLEDRISFKGTIGNPLSLDRTRSLEFYYNQIAGIAVKKSFTSDKIIINTTGSTNVEFKTYDKTSNTDFCNFVNSKISAYRNKLHEHTSNLEKSIPEQIKELAQLNESGIITEEEFNEKKKILLSKIV